MINVKFRFIDLFAGIGGFHLGLEKNGGYCVYANEWDKFASITYQNWFPETFLDTRDIRRIDLRRDIPRHDVLAGGFPCQPFSLAGVSKKNSMGVKHGFSDLKQGNLFLYICKITELHQPKVVFLENVKNLVSHDRGRTWKLIQSKLEDLGYKVFWKIIDANAWVPQHRERIYIVAFRCKSFTKEEISDFRFPTSPKSYPKLRKILEKSTPKKYMLSDKLWAYLVQYSKKHRALGNGFGYSLADPDSQSRTLSARYAKDGSEILVKEKGKRNPRRLTPHEAAGLMGFDASWSKKHGNGFPQAVSDTQAYRQFGNSVCPHVVNAIAQEIARILERRNRRLLRNQLC